MSAMTVRGEASLGVSALEADIAARAQTMEGYRICAKCGVDRFSQRPVRGG